MTKSTAARWFLVALSSLLLGACATPPSAGGDPRDPYENFNRKVFTVNAVVDRAVIKPVARGYTNYTPEFIQNTVGNFFGNLADVWTALNNYLQFKPRDGTIDVGRVLINSTLGIAGLADVATPLGLPKHEEDFGQTLAVWGVKSGPYVVLPLFGPSTMRDTFGKPVDLYADPLGQFNMSTTYEYSARAVRLVDDRARALPATDLIEQASLDPYQFMRDAYLQRREARVRDGNVDSEK
jgi:phospholipid-binding lipoprotein MlaA